MNRRENIQDRSCRLKSGHVDNGEVTASTRFGHQLRSARKGVVPYCEPTGAFTNTWSVVSQRDEEASIQTDRRRDRFSPKD